jgi:uncharacterized membrane protein
MLNAPFATATEANAINAVGQVVGNYVRAGPGILDRAIGGISA